MKPRGAEFSEDGKYRYRLWRIWDDRKPLAMCIGLNPSTANANKDDATIRNLFTILSQLGYGGFYMMNLFAYISSRPDDLLNTIIDEDKQGDNERHLLEVEKLCDHVIICWGNFKQAKERIKEVLPRYPNAKCFGKNLNGTPFHPRALTYIKGGLKNPELINYF